MVKEFDPMMDSLSYFYPEIRQSTVYVRDFVIPHGTYLRPAREMEMMNGQHRQTMMFTGMLIWIRER